MNGMLVILVILLKFVFIVLGSISVIIVIVLMRQLFKISIQEKQCVRKLVRKWLIVSEIVRMFDSMMVMFFKFGGSFNIWLLKVGSQVMMFCLIIMKRKVLKMKIIMSICESSLNMVRKFFFKLVLGILLFLLNLVWQRNMKDIIERLVSSQYIFN